MLLTCWSETTSISNIKLRRMEYNDQTRESCCVLTFRGELETEIQKQITISRAWIDSMHTRRAGTIKAVSCSRNLVSLLSHTQHRRLLHLSSLFEARATWTVSSFNSFEPKTTSEIHNPAVDPAKTARLTPSHWSDWSVSLNSRFNWIVDTINDK